MLQKMGDSVQQIADAIALALDSNVTIVDENLVRVAGTSPYQKMIAKKTPEKPFLPEYYRNRKQS